MSMRAEISTYLRHYVSTSDTLSGLYLPGWILSSWLPFPHLPPLHITGSGKEALLRVLVYLCQEIRVVRAVHGMTVSPTIVAERPTGLTDFFDVAVESTGQRPEHDAAFRLSIGRWARDRGPDVMDVFWYMLDGARPDALAAVTATLLVAEEGVSIVESPPIPDIALSIPDAVKPMPNAVKAPSRGRIVKAKNTSRKKLQVASRGRKKEA